jgi:hypothetical protein
MVWSFRLFFKSRKEKKFLEKNEESSRIFKFWRPIIIILIFLDLYLKGELDECDFYLY